MNERMSGEFEKSVCFHVLKCTIGRDKCKLTILLAWLLNLRTWSSRSIVFGHVLGRRFSRSLCAPDSRSLNQAQVPTAPEPKICQVEGTLELQLGTQRREFCIGRKLGTGSRYIFCTSHAPDGTGLQQIGIPPERYLVDNM